MTTHYKNLFSPLKVGPLTFKNRILASPISLFDVNLGTPNKSTAKDTLFYKLRSLGGPALVTVGDSVVHASGIAPGSAKLLLDSNNIIAFLTDITEEIHRYGAYASIELNHGGCRAARANFPGLGPDETTTDNGYLVKAMNREEIEEIADSFGLAAKRCKLAGFDMVTLHAGHGWLLGSFHSPLTNHRTDEFGGSIENRARFTMMAIDAIRKYCGKDFPIEVRISGSEMTEGGIPLEEGVQLAKMLDGVADLIHVSAGTLIVAETETITHPSLFLKHGCNVFLAEEISKHVHTPVVTVGSLSDPAMMEDILERKAADAVAIGRALIADPYLPKKAYEGREDEIRPCLRCLNCLGYGMVTGSVRCSVNPVIGHEADYFYSALPYDTKRILIAGGGTAGMQAAITAAERGHSVTLCEKCSTPGGILCYADNVNIKHDLTDFKNYLIRRIHALDIDVRTDTEVTPEFIEEFHPDILIIAIGSKPLLPPVTGIEHAVPLLDYYLGGKETGERVTIIGGGLAGCEAAIELADKGKTVTVVEMKSIWAEDANEMHRSAMETQLKDRVTIHTLTCCKEITENEVICDTSEGPLSIPSDTVLLAAGMKAKSEEADKLTIPGIQTIRIGDCQKAGQVKDAVRSGYDAAMAAGLRF